VAAPAWWSAERRSRTFPPQDVELGLFGLIGPASKSLELRVTPVNGDVSVPHPLIGVRASNSLVGALKALISAKA